MFKNLEERFNNKVNELYGKHSAQDGTATHPLLEIKPNDPRASETSTDTRSDPEKSKERDIRRISTWVTSSEGKLFLQLQKTLQTGNSFSETREIKNGFILDGVRGNRPKRARLSQSDSVLLDFRGTKSPASTLKVGYGGRLQQETKQSAVGRVAHVVTADRIISALGLGNLIGRQNMVNFGSLGVNDRPELDIAGRYYSVLLWNKEAFRSPQERLANGLYADISRIAQSDTFRRIENRVRQSATGAIGSFIGNVFNVGSRAMHFSFDNNKLPSFIGQTLGRGGVLQGVGGVLEEMYSEAAQSIKSSIRRTAENTLNRMISTSPLRGMFTSLFSSRFNLNPLSYGKEDPQRYFILDENEVQGYLNKDVNLQTPRPYWFDNTGFSTAISVPRGEVATYTTANLFQLGRSTYDDRARPSVADGFTFPRSSLQFKYNNDAILQRIQNDIDDMRSRYMIDTKRPDSLGIVGGYNLLDFNTDQEFQEKNRLLPARRYFVEKSNGAIAKPGFLHDKLNMVTPTTPNDAIKDSVNVVFEQVAGKKIRFRALITDISETVSPSYSETNYTGRVEKNIIYTNVTRDISFGLTIHALSADELVPIWRNISWLTGLAYPKNYSEAGHIVPPLVKLTIGNVYVGETGYIKSINKSIEDSTPWEIAEGHQVPHGIKITLTFGIIEKVRKVNDSLFHGYGSAATTPTAIENTLTTKVQGIANQLTATTAAAAERLSAITHPILNPREWFRNG